MVMVAIGMNSMPLKIIGKMFVYKLEVFLGYQRTCHGHKNNQDYKIF